MTFKFRKGIESTIILVEDAVDLVGIPEGGLDRNREDLDMDREDGHVLPQDPSTVKTNRRSPGFMINTSHYHTVHN